MIGNPNRSTRRVAGMLLYPISGNCVLEYDDTQGRRRAMLLSEDLDEIAALDRAWLQPSFAVARAMRDMDTLENAPTTLGTPHKGPRLRYLLGWDFNAKGPVIRERQTA